jgi:predicted HTH domain antitoxin
MNIQVNLQLPDTIFSALRKTPDEFVSEMRVTAAVKWYEMQLVSQAKAAEIAGLSRHDFLLALSRFNVSPFQTTPEELQKEIERD